MAHKVVVVEDEPQVVELLRLILRHAEIEVFTALDGTTGLELIRKVKPNLVLLDIMMPNMNGWDVYDAIRTDADLKHIPVIVESVLPERSERKVTFAESPIDYYFTKPFDTMRLRREVGRMLGNEAMWPPPKPRPPRPLSIKAASEFLSMTQTPPASPARAAAETSDKPLPKPPLPSEPVPREIDEPAHNDKPLPTSTPVENKPDQPAPKSQGAS